MRQTVESYSVAKRSCQPNHSTSMGEAPMEIDVVQVTRARKANTEKARRARTKAKESTKANTRASRSSRATVVTAESGDTSRKTVDTRTEHRC